MTFIPWSDEYLVDVRVIDNDHRALFEIVNSLHDGVAAGASSRHIAETLTALQDYVSQHFAREELYMKECGYPGYEAHVAKHQNLSNTVKAMVDSYRADPNKVNTAELLEFLKDWLVNHILKSDMDFAPYLRGEKTGDLAVKAPNGGDHVSDPKLQTLTVTVPIADADLMKRLATMLADGGDEAEALKAFAAERT